MRPKVRPKRVRPKRAALAMAVFYHAFYAEFSFPVLQHATIVTKVGLGCTAAVPGGGFP